MSYAIGNVIYGVPWTEELENYYNELENKDQDLYYSLPDKLGFEMLYSASAQIYPGYLGVSLAKISECNDVKLSDLISKQPTEKQKEDIRKQIEVLPQAARELMDEADIYIIWSSS